MGKLPQILPQNFTVPHSLTCRNQTVQHMKMGKYSVERGIITLRFHGKYASLPLPVFEEPWQTLGTTWLPAAARLIIRQMAPLSSSNIANAFGIPSGLALAVEYRAIAALQFLKFQIFPALLLFGVLLRVTLFEFYRCLWYQKTYVFMLHVMLFCDNMFCQCDTPCRAMR